MLRYHRGLFLPEGGMTIDKLAREQKADEIFLTLLARYDREGRKVSDKSTSPNYASAMFRKEKEATGVQRRTRCCHAALFAAGKIHVEKLRTACAASVEASVRTRGASGVTRPQHAARIF